MESPVVLTEDLAGRQENEPRVVSIAHHRLSRLPELPDHLREAVNEHARVSFRYNSLGLPVEVRSDVHLIKLSRDVVRLP